MKSIQPVQCSCKICTGTADLFGVVDFSKNCREPQQYYLSLSGIPIYYYRCTSCGLLFSRHFDDWNIDDFSKYIYNENYQFVDPDYQTVRPDNNFCTVKQLTGMRRDLRLLDYGGGNGRLTDLLVADGNCAHSYDPISRVSTVPATMKFDLITVIEVIEHCARPQETAQAIVDYLADDGVVFFTTLLLDKLAIRDVSHWYIAPRNGHITIYSRQALATLFGDVGYSVLHFDNNFHLAYKKLPSWMSHINIRP